jgi:hypothetical protein
MHMADNMDPEATVDRLPQPYRMIDKVLVSIVEHALSLAQERERVRKLEEASTPELVSFVAIMMCDASSVLMNYKVLEHRPCLYLNLD